MLIVLRIVLAVGLGCVIKLAWDNAQSSPHTGDLLNAAYLAAALLLALANAVVWAPFFGARLSEPLTSVLTKSTYVESRNHLLRWVRWLDRRGHRRWTAWFCLLEGIHHPDLPTAFVLGLKNAPAGSWLEKAFAAEVFRFDNTQNCVAAYHALRKHGIDPRPHRNPQVNLVLLSLDRQESPERTPLPVPPAPERPPLARDTRIRLFDTPDAAVQKPAETPPGPLPGETSWDASRGP